MGSASKKARHMPTTSSGLCQHGYISLDFQKEECLWDALGPCSSCTALAMSRRAAHFARFGAADDEEEEGNNPHTGGNEVCAGLITAHTQETFARCMDVDALHHAIQYAR